MKNNLSEIVVFPLSLICAAQVMVGGGGRPTQHQRPADRDPPNVAGFRLSAE
jgi:hypothetical protein